MPNPLEQDTLVAQNFFLEIEGETMTYLSGVSGLDVEVDVVESLQNTKDGKKVIRKTLGTHIRPPDLTLTRVAPPAVDDDKLWQWFNDIHQKGMPLASRKDKRKDGSVVVYDSSMNEVARFNFYNAWPTKVSTDGFEVDSNEPVKETITLVCERLERKK